MSRTTTRTKERQILRAAEKLFVTRRFHEVTMDAVSREAGVGKGTIYRYFTDKDALFLGVVMAGFDDLHGIVARTARSDLPLRERLLKVVAGICRSFARRRPLFRMMHAEHSRMAEARAGLHSRWRKHRGKLRAAVADIIRAGVEAGELRGDISVDALSGALLGILRGQMSRDRRRVSRRETEEIVQLFLEGALTAPRRTRKGAAS